MATQTFVKFEFAKEDTHDTHDKVNELIANEMQQPNKDNVINNDIVCSHCLKPGHIIKTCPSAVVSYGLICYYQKQITIDATSTSNNFFNKRTRKQTYQKQGYYNCNTNFRKNHNLPKIKILKRNETLNYTLKNMLGLTSANNDIDNTLIDNTTLDNTTLDNYELEEHTHTENATNNSSNNPDDENANENAKETKHINTYKVILVQRRNTIGFIEFMRGKYEVENHEYIIKLFNMLTFDEKRILREYEAFDAIRKIIGLGRDNIYKKEYDESKSKFEMLQNHTEGNMIYKLLDKSITRWNSPEWGVPKGRRKVWVPHNYNNPSQNCSGEIEIDCAVREFVEETGIKYNNLIVYRNVKPLEELYKGINGVLYKHVYYLAMVKDNEEARTNVECVERGGQYNFEVSNVKCFGLSECHRIIRPYYISKLNAIKKGFQLINCINTYFE
jgi:8-oxo-dGTP pyrophosphatase MutT (NUDIX family)